MAPLLFRRKVSNNESAGEVTYHDTRDEVDSPSSADQLLLDNCLQNRGIVGASQQPTTFENIFFPKGEREIFHSPILIA
jgi:hypothetical protein